MQLENSYVAQLDAEKMPAFLREEAGQAGGIRFGSHMMLAKVGLL
jgi:hypothetical protein